MKAKTLCSLFVAVLFSLATFGSHARTLGMVANDGDNDSVTVFDADTHAVLGTVPLNTAGPAIGDVLITPDLKRGFVTNGFNGLFVIDLTTSPPSLAGGTNPIPISDSGADIAISTNGKFLIVSGGTPNEPISVVDIAAQAEISTFVIAPDSSPFSVDVCSDGSILATSNQFFAETNTVHRLTLSTAGILSDTGEMLSVSSTAVNVYCAPGARSGVVIRRFPPGVGV
jgi:DNA-binding beta-propeller fold protein YncE